MVPEGVIDRTIGQDVKPTESTNPNVNYAQDSDQSSNKMSNQSSDKTGDAKDRDTTDTSTTNTPENSVESATGSRTDAQQDAALSNNIPKNLSDIPDITTPKTDSNAVHNPDETTSGSDDKTDSPAKKDSATSDEDNAKKSMGTESGASNEQNATVSNVTTDTEKEMQATVSSDAPRSDSNDNAADSHTSEADTSSDTNSSTAASANRDTHSAQTQPTETTTFAATVSSETVTKGSSFVLEGVTFEHSSAQLTDESSAILNNVADTLKEKVGIKIEIAGYTDNTGKSENNKKLSQKRADAVKSYLMNHGVSGSSMTAKGYGSANPIADNRTKAGRDRNRRVELHVK
jgi:outer membrane protein OmpA-like peptidoglycan-associated protein